MSDRMTIRGKDNLPKYVVDEHNKVIDCIKPDLCTCKDSPVEVAEHSKCLVCGKLKPITPEE